MHSTLKLEAQSSGSKPGNAVQGRHPSQYAWDTRSPDPVRLRAILRVQQRASSPGAGGEPGALTAHARF